LIHTPNVKTNQVWVKKVLEKLEENQLFSKKEKCHFKKEDIEFLGMQLAAGVIRVSPGKIEAILKESVPKTKKGVKRFLRLTNYHHRFI
jgi:hypothetical protein